MQDDKPVFDQVNVVSSNVASSLAFYRRLGMEIPDERVWSTATGAHHAGAIHPGSSEGFDFDIDSDAFAQIWNAGWAGRNDLAGRVVLGFRLPSREAVDARYADLTGAGYRGLQAPCDAFWGARYAVVEDPDGIAVGLMSPISDRFRKEPPTV